MTGTFICIFAGGLNPHMYCLPVAKREEDRQAIRKAAVSGDPRFFFGSDSRFILKFTAPDLNCITSRKALIFIILENLA